MGSWRTVAENIRCSLLLVLPLRHPHPRSGNRSADIWTSSHVNGRHPHRRVNWSAAIWTSSNVNGRPPRANDATPRQGTTCFPPSHAKGCPKYPNCDCESPSSSSLMVLHKTRGASSSSPYSFGLPSQFLTVAGGASKRGGGAVAAAATRDGGNGFAVFSPIHRPIPGSHHFSTGALEVEAAAAHAQNEEDERMRNVIVKVAAEPQHISSSNSTSVEVEEALRAYLKANVEVASGEDAEFICRKCPVFISKLAASLNDEQVSETVDSRIRNFIECEAREADKLNEKEHYNAVGKNGMAPPPPLSLTLTLGDMFRLWRLPWVVRAEHEEALRQGSGVLENMGLRMARLGDILKRNPELQTWMADELQAKAGILESAGLRRKDALLTFMEDPSVFNSQLEERLAPFLRYLAEVGIEKRALEDLLKFNPQGLIRMPETTFRERVNYLFELGLSSSEVERSMRVFPQLFHLRLSNLIQKISYFDGLGVGRDSMGRVVARVPSIFRHSIDKNLAPKVQLLESIGVVNGSLVRFIARYPQFFGCSLENLKGKVDFFQTNVLPGERLVKMIGWHPRAFSFSVDKNLSKKLQYLVSKGFVVRSTAMARALASCITISPVSLEARVQNLQSLGFTHKEVCELVTTQPTIFCLSEKTIRVKMDYLVNTMKRPSAEILRCPGYLLYSLDSRIKPRHRVMELLESKGLLKMNGGYSLSTILQPSEEKFVKKYVSLDPGCLDVYLAGSEKRDLGDGKRQEHQRLTALGIARKKEEQQRTSSRLIEDVIPSVSPNAE